MEESVTYQEIIGKGRAEGRAEGKAEEAQRILLLLGANAFGPPDRATKAALERLVLPEQLEALIQRVGHVKSWQQLLAKPRPQRRNGRKKR